MRFTQHCLVLLFVIVAGSPAAAQSSAASPASTRPSAEFLRREGRQLLLGGKPFRRVGVNKWELLHLYLDPLIRDRMCGGRDEAILALDELERRGIDVVRLQGCPFYPVQVEHTWLGPPATRERFWKLWDDMVADCARRRIRLAPAVTFNWATWPDLAHESLHDFVTNPESESRKLFARFLRELVTRYRDEPTILYWELINEGNLIADLAPIRPEGVFPRVGPTLARPPIVRDGRNNMSAAELGRFNHEIATFIKSLDPNHLVAGGEAMPRPAAWHLWKAGERGAKQMDWTRDTEAQQAEYLRLINPAPMDLLSVHHYLVPGAHDDLSPLANLARVAAELDRPLYFGEMGPASQCFPGSVYSHSAALVALEAILAASRQLDVPITLLWTFEESCRIPHEPVIRRDQAGVMSAIETGQAAARRRVDGVGTPDWVEAAGELRTLEERLAAATRPGG